ncbi:peptidase S8/S53 domain-containing protein [Colletotrichum godetiae]|uniref:Peptidase S8/S53 domain-containing protein n=1 Tax=Colletotrichum godetiae TaxID=1209918 RepID=A0AAJ0AHG6_9PEZI|nr:peptidase S8/S53 domain-containing protein [Colletotrichum godetiae]KAK1672523.1 peptidase S8/S53 domain-containing protein [Colletotrichum godetiae]
MSFISATAVLLTLGLRALAAPAPASVTPDGIIPGEYIVSLKPGLARSQVESHLSRAASVHSRSPSRRDTTGIDKAFSIGAFNAYAGSFDEVTIAEIISGDVDGAVLSVEPNRLVEIDALVTQDAATWGLASLSSLNQLTGSSDGQPYTYDDSAGEGSFAYILDTGVQVYHPDFAGHAVKGYSSQPDEEFDDFGGHGTHVAGTVGSQTYGVAKKATVVDVKVLAGFDKKSNLRAQGTGSVATVLDGYNWAVNNITDTPGRLAKSVISMSLVSTTASALDEAVNAAYDLGVPTVVSAGNLNQDASRRSPARAERAFTVAAADWNRTRASFSNFGSLVEVFAPGVEVRSLGLDNSTTVYSGTSQAVPHVTGLIAYLRGKEEGLATPDEVFARVKELAVEGVIRDPQGTANLLAFNGTVSS